MKDFAVEIHVNIAGDERIMTSVEGLTRGHDERGKFPEVLHKVEDLTGRFISLRGLTVMMPNETYHDMDVEGRTDCPCYN